MNEAGERIFVARSAIPELLARLSPTELLRFARLPPLTVIDHDSPPSPLVGVPTVAVEPTTAKLLAETPVTTSLTIARKVRLSALVVALAGFERLSELKVGAMLSSK